MWAQLDFAAAVVTVLFLSHFSYTTMALKISPFQRAPKATAVNQRSEDDLSSLLYTQPADQEGLFSEALQLLNSMKSSPSCNRMAVTNLITSCQQLDPDDESRVDHTQADLDYIKSLYAARLAICEVTGAGARIPDECSVLVDPKPSRIFRQGHGTEPEDDTGIDTGQLESCLQALESKPQWWTSYSNNRQNAAVMCQAARIEMERDELLNHHRNLVEITVGISRSLNQSLGEAASEAAQHKAFVETVDSMRLQLMQDVQDSRTAARDLFQNLAMEVEESLRGTVNSIQTNVASAGSDTAALSKEIQSSVASARNLKQALNHVYSDAMQRGSELAAADQVNLKANSELALSVQHSLEEIRQQRTELMVEQFDKLHISLQSLNGLVSSVRRNHESLDERLNNFDQAFRQLEYKAETLDMILQWHLTNHSRLQQSLESDMRVAQAILAEITASTANLQATMSETYQVVNKIGSVGIAMGSAPRWLWALTCFGAVGLVAPKVVVASFVVCAGLLSTGLIGRLRLVQWPSPDFDWSTSYLEIGCFFVGFSLAAAAVITIARKGVLPIPYTFRISSRPQAFQSNSSYLP